MFVTFKTYLLTRFKFKIPQIKLIEDALIKEQNNTKFLEGLL